MLSFTKDRKGRFKNKLGIKNKETNKENSYQKKKTRKNMLVAIYIFFPSPVIFESLLC